MKEVFLIRHGKSDWDRMDVKDADRPLKGRGVRDARTMAAFLGERYTIPQRILTSPACRAVHTAVIFCRTMKSSCDTIRIRESLYLASYNELLPFIREASGEYQILALVGHNPGITDIANFFLEEPIHNIPTSGFVYMAFDAERWQEVKAGNLIKHAFHTPKELLTE